jgi:hypothetical protein
MTISSEMWAAMSGLDRSVWIAEHLFERIIVRHGTIADAEYCHRDRMPRIDRSRYVYPTQIPLYAIEVGPDYSVLKHVRETWNGQRASQFGDHLLAIWERRGGEPKSMLYACAYQPGDYSHAAYLSMA